MVDPFETLLEDDQSGGEGEGSEEEGEGWSQAIDEENPEEVEGMGVSHNSSVEGMPLLFSSQQDDTARGQAVAQQISRRGLGEEGTG